MRLLTYNIRLGIQQGLDAVAAVIRGARPDVVALQEVGDRWTMGPPGDSTEALALATGLSHGLHVPAIVTESDNRYGHAVLSRWPLEDASILALPQEIDEPRRVLTARVAVPGGPPLHLVTTHLSHLPEERPRHGVVLADHVAALLDQTPAGEPVVVMGDLNDPGPAPWLDRLLGMLDDAAADAPEPTYPASAPEVRIDWLLAARASWVHAERLADADASDHLGVLGVLDRGRPES